MKVLFSKWLSKFNFRSTNVVKQKYQEEYGNKEFTI